MKKPRDVRLVKGDISFSRESNRASHNPWKGWYLNVTRLGQGYWIGAICTTILYVFHPVFFALGRHYTGPYAQILDPPLYYLGAGVQLVFLNIMLFGAVRSFFRAYLGRLMRDPDAIVGGILGFLLCSWPFILGVICSFQYACSP